MFMKRQDNSIVSCVDAVEIDVFVCLCIQMELFLPFWLSLRLASYCKKFGFGT